VAVRLLPELSVAADDANVAAVRDDPEDRVAAPCWVNNSVWENSIHPTGPVASPSEAA
jgi:hypothetical protein